MSDSSPLIAPRISMRCVQTSNEKFLLQ